MVNITPEVNDCLRESGIQEGLCLVNAMNITASVFINDDEHGLHQDYEVWLEWLAHAARAPSRIADMRMKVMMFFPFRPRKPGKYFWDWFCINMNIILPLFLM